jgi:hypothetical protein
MGYNPTTQIISQPVSVYDVQQCCWVRLQRTVSGQTQTRYSGDVGVLCCAQVGDTIPSSDSLGRCDKRGAEGDDARGRDCGVETQNRRIGNEIETLKAA